MRKKRFGYSRSAALLTISCAGITLGSSGLLLATDFALRVICLPLVLLSWTVPVLMSIRFRTAYADKMKKFATASGNLAASEGRLTRTIEKARKDASRHEYHQEQALQRIERDVRSLAFIRRSGNNIERTENVAQIIFITSNGAGLGHITRLLAIADELPPNVSREILTLSLAYKQVVDHGIAVHYFPSSEAAEVQPGKWNRIFAEYLIDLFTKKRPRLIVFDGTWVYQSLTDVCRAMNLPIVWVQRGLWKSEVDQASPQRHSAIDVADYVIVPGDYSDNETVEAGPGVEPVHVDPIVRSSRNEILSRTAACSELGLDTAKRYVLINLGGGSLGMPESFIKGAADVIHQTNPELYPIRLASPLSKDVHSNQYAWATITAYPVMKYAAAFEFIVAAGGYNSVQEIAAHGIPSILIPNRATKTDDQVRRVNGMAAQGYCLLGEDRMSLSKSVEKLSSVSERERIIARLGSLREAKGAVQAAATILETLEKESWMDRADSFRSDGKTE